MDGTTRKPEFIEGKEGKLFCIEYIPETGSNTVTVIIPPFAEEMNKSRRMLSQQAAMLAAKGCASVLFDFYGTGDSEGDFSDATWEIWCNDISKIISDMLDANMQHVNILAMRTGALFTPYILREHKKYINKVVFWQPVPNGAVFLNQFYRLKLAESMMSDGKKKESTSDIKRSIAEGNPVEIAGYMINPELVQGMSKVVLTDMQGTDINELSWFEIIIPESNELPPASQRVIENLTNNKINVNISKLHGQQFWSTVELVDLPELLEMTVGVICPDEH